MSLQTEPLKNDFENNQGLSALYFLIYDQLPLEPHHIYRNMIFFIYF